MFRKFDHVIGFCGDMPHAAEYVEWYRSGLPMPEALRELKGKTDFNVLILIGRRIYGAVGMNRPTEIRNVGIAVGDGAQTAIYAMDAGADAVDAARLACDAGRGCKWPIASMYV